MEPHASLDSHINRPIEKGTIRSAMAETEEGAERRNSQLSVALLESSTGEQKGELLILQTLSFVG